MEQGEVVEDRPRDVRIDITPARSPRTYPYPGHKIER
jgi:hypothetical protein